MIITHYSPSEYRALNMDIINAGTSNDNIKTIELSKKYKNPKFYPRKFQKWRDEFSVTLLENAIQVRRTDVKVGGWGETLLIDVEFDNEESKLTPFQKIPRVIYQTFETFDLPKGMFDSVNSWRNMNSDYEHYFFTGEQRIEFIKKYFDKDVLNAYMSLIPGAFKADLWRCCVLYEKGGIYVDSDMVCLKRLNEYITPDDEFIIGRDDPMSKKFLSNGFITSIPKHNFLKKQIDNIVDNVLNHRIRYYLDISGPGLLGKSVNSVCGLPEETEFNLGLNEINNFTFKVILHDWKTKTFKINDADILLTEYVGKNNEMMEIDNPSFYSLVQKNMIYQIIPRKIYYTSYDYLGINTYMVNSFTEKNKDWKLEYYTDDDCVEFLRKNNNEFLELLNIDVLSFYSSLENGGERSDFWRYCMIYLNGGVYTDADTYCNISLDKWIQHHDLIFGVEACVSLELAKSFGMDKVGITIRDKVISVCNWTFAAKPKHVFFKNLIIDIYQNRIYGNVLLNTGPGRFTKHVSNYFSDIDLIEIDKKDIIKDLSILYSINRFGANQSHSNSLKNYSNVLELDSKDVYVIHTFEGSWRTLKNKKIKLIKSRLGVSHNMAIEENNGGYIGISRLDKDTGRTLFMKQIGDCRSVVEYNFDNAFNLISETEIPITNYNKIAKFEDFRIFRYKNKRFFSVSYIDENFNTKVAILNSNYSFLGNVNIDDYNVVSWIGLEKIWEKNWLFFEKEDDLFFIYSTTPRYVVYKCTDFNELKFEKVINIEFPVPNTIPENEFYFTSYMGSKIKIATGGSTNPIFIKEKNVYLYFIHTRNYGEQKYNHYGILLDENLIPIKLIPEPVIKKYVPYGLMFVSSVIETENYLVFSGGIHDNTNFIWELSKHHLFKLFGI